MGCYGYDIKGKKYLSTESIKVDDNIKIENSNKDKEKDFNNDEENYYENANNIQDNNNGNNIEDKKEKNKQTFDNKETKTNIILAEINIGENNVNKDIRIINTYEESKRINNWAEEKDEYKNEQEIKESCTIKINDKIIEFNYLYKFKEKGKYKIKYSFKRNIKNVAFMFSWM